MITLQGGPGPRPGPDTETFATDIAIAVGIVCLFAAACIVLTLGIFRLEDRWQSHSKHAPATEQSVPIPKSKMPEVFRALARPKPSRSG